MTPTILSKVLRFSVVGLMSGVLCPALHAKSPLPDAPAAMTQPAFSFVVAPTKPSAEHKFWDKENRVLFAASAGLSVADFAVTRANLQSGGRELNPVVRAFGTSTPGLAANFVGENVGVIGLSYFLHKTGHHKLERVVSMVNIGGSAGAIGYGLASR